MEVVGVARRLKPGVEREDTAEEGVATGKGSKRAADENGFSGGFEEVEESKKAGFGDL